MKIEIDDSDLHVMNIKISTKQKDIENRLTRTMTSIVNDLKKKVVDDKLNGGALKRRTGDLFRSVSGNVTNDNGVIIGVVKTTGIRYARIHEYGGVVRTRLGTGVGKPKVGGKATFIMPMRSFMRSSLQERRQSIIRKLSLALKEGNK